MMTTAAFWPTQTVDTFWGAVPWQGNHSSPTDLSPTTEVFDWRSLTVQDFFSSIAWDGRLLQSHSGSETAQTLSYLMPVQSFFGCFFWEGRPTIGAIPQLNISPTKVPELSLKDLSDLF